MKWGFHGKVLGTRESLKMTTVYLSGPQHVESGNFKFTHRKLNLDDNFLMVNFPKTDLAPTN